MASHPHPPVPLAMLAAAACLAAMGCAGTPPSAEPPAQAAAEAAPRTAPAISGLRTPREDLLTAGQPAPDAWATLPAQGVTTVINLRPDAELQGRDEAAEVADAGLAYHHIPVAGADDLTADNAARLWRLLESAEGRVLVHCASGNRAGALLAIGATNEGGMAPEEALAFGRAAGLASPRLEETVRGQLGLSSATTQEE